MRTIRLLHRIAVDWTADTFGLTGQSARARHEAARDRAYGRARQWHESARDAGRARSRWLVAAAHQPREARLLRSWQAAIGRLASGQARP